MPPPCEQPLWQAELDKRSCSELILKLARALDRCDEVLMRSLFHDDATDDHGYFRGSATEFVDWVLPLLATMERTQHNISNILVNVRGDRAVSEAYFVAYHDLAGPNGAPIRMIAAGRYLDRFERRDRDWKIAHRTAIFDWSASEPRTDQWDRTGAARYLGERGQGDELYGHLASLGGDA